MKGQVGDHKICPLLSAAMPKTEPFIYCQKSDCELWTTVWTTETRTVSGCAIKMKVGVNSEGLFVV